MSLVGHDIAIRVDEPDQSKARRAVGHRSVRPDRAAHGRLRHPARWVGEEVSVDVQSEIIIDRTVDAVAAYAADPSNAPEWYAKIDSVDWQTPPPATVGSKMTFVARFLGRRLEYTYEIVELVAGERL